MVYNWRSDSAYRIYNLGPDSPWLELWWSLQGPRMVTRNLILGPGLVRRKSLQVSIAPMGSTGYTIIKTPLNASSVSTLASSLSMETLWSTDRLWRPYWRQLICTDSLDYQANQWRRIDAPDKMSSMDVMAVIKKYTIVRKCPGLILDNLQKIKNLCHGSP